MVKSIMFNNVILLWYRRSTKVIQDDFFVSERINHWPNRFTAYTVHPIRPQSNLPEDTEKEKAYLTKTKIHSVTWKLYSFVSCGTSSTLLLLKTEHSPFIIRMKNEHRIIHRALYICRTSSFTFIDCWIYSRQVTMSYIMSCESECIQ